jgi:hypothetical protein
MTCRNAATGQQKKKQFLSRAMLRLAGIAGPDGPFF